MKKQFTALLVGLMIVLPAFAADYKEGVHYFPLKETQPVQTGKQIEVTELFWYGCPHCYNLEPVIQSWLKNKPENADYVPLPSVLRDSWAIHARAYFAFEALGQVENLHGPFFDAIHKGRQRFHSAEDVAEFAAEHGVDKQSIIDAYNSFAVDSKVQHARIMGERYEAMGVPTIIIDGKYRVTSSSAGGHAELMDLVNFLVIRAATER